MADTPEPNRRPRPTTSVLHWRVYTSGLDPLYLVDVATDVNRHCCNGLPGSVISRIEFDGTDLKIYLKESS
jgi:hypothetical protein